MKIQFVEETDSRLLAEDIVKGEDIAPTSNPEIAALLDEGVEAAQNGDRAEARHLLLKVTERDPRNEAAWLWLASISEYPEELLIFLENVLDINPKNERALNWSAETKTLLAKTFVQRGIDAKSEDKIEFAKQCFLQAIVHDSKSELAWMWLASVSEADGEKISHLRKVININPDNEKAAKSLERAQARIAESLLEKAKASAESGDNANADKYLDECLFNDPNSEGALLLKGEIAEDFDEKIEFIERVLKINPKNEAAHAALETAKGEFVQSKLSRAKAAVESGNDQEANSLLDEIILGSPDMVEAWLLKAEITDSIDEKIAGYKKALEIEPGNQVAQEAIADKMFDKAKLLVSAARSARERGEQNDAKRLADEALSFAPELEEALLLRSELSSSAEQKTNLLNRVLAINPDNHRAKAALHEVEKENLEQTISEARISFESGMFDEASILVKNALETDPDNVEALMLKSEMSDSADEKRELVERVLEINPENVSAKDSLRRLDTEKANELLAEATSAASAGNKELAESLLSDVFNYNNEAENAWLLKAHISDSLDEKVNCFKRVLEINADNEAAKANLLSLESMIQTSNPEPAPESQPSNQQEPLKEEDSSEADFDSEEKFEAPEEEIDALFLGGTPETNEVREAREMAAELQEAEAAPSYEVNEPEAEYPAIEMPQDSANFLTSANETVNEYETEEVAAVVEPEQQDSVDSVSPVSDDMESRSKRILVVDNNPTTRKLVSGKLEKSGHETYCAIDGMDAVNMLEEMTPDLVLLDLAIPGMDGYQVCKVIRENDATTTTPVIMVSGKDIEFDETKGNEVGSTGHISKPFGPETLMKIVNEHLM